jgi:hypothetical protein
LKRTLPPQQSTQGPISPALWLASGLAHALPSPRYSSQLFFFFLVGSICCFQEASPLPRHPQPGRRLEVLDPKCYCRRFVLVCPSSP